MKPDTELPDNTEYWDAQAEKLATYAIREARQTAVSWVATSGTGWVVAGVCAGALSLFVIASASRTVSTSASDLLIEALAPADDVGITVILGEQPPALGALLLDRTRDGVK
jgi:hypothetical protein